MLPRTYDNQVCSIARALEVIGDRWTMLVIRDAFLGVRRFEYLLTAKGSALWPVLVSLMKWGDRFAPTTARPHASGIATAAAR